MPAMVKIPTGGLAELRLCPHAADPKWLGHFGGGTEGYDLEAGRKPQKNLTCLQTVSQFKDSGSDVYSTLEAQTS